MFVSLSQVRVVCESVFDAEITFGGNVRQKENLIELCCSVLFFSRASKVAFDKNKALKRVKERKRETKVLTHHSFSPPLSAFARVFSLRLVFASSGGDDALFTRREWNAEKRIRFLCTDDDEDAIFGHIHPRSGNFDDDFDE